MKLILSIVHNEDGNKALAALNNAGFGVTKLATTGAFLSSGTTTLLIGTNEERISTLKEILRKTCVGTKQAAPSVSAFGLGSHDDDETAGGATMFGLNVESFEKI